MSQPKSQTNPHSGLRVIAILKFAKGVALGVGLGLFRLINPNVPELGQRIAAHLRIYPENYYLRHAISKLTDVSPRMLHNLGLLSLFFTVDLLVENGVGLWDTIRPGLSTSSWSPPGSSSRGDLQRHPDVLLGETRPFRDQPDRGRLHRRHPGPRRRTGGPAPAA